MSQETNPPPNRRGPALVALGVVALVGVVIAGVFAARNTDRTEVRLASPESTVATTGASTAPPEARASERATPAPRAPQGTGDPVELSGTDPVTGSAVRLASFTGKPVVLLIWASWCPGCNEEAPDVATIASRRSDVHFVGLNYRDSADGARGFVDRYGWAFPSIEDRSGDRSFGLGLQGTPTTIFLDARHREVGRIVGATDQATLNDAVNQLTGS
ncbi:MAG: TlpA disulfide reductase family protein [Thermoleophilia bacterium]